MATKDTRNHQLAVVAEVANKVLFRYPNLPNVASVNLGSFPTGDDLVWVPGVRLHVPYPRPAGIALWALEFGASVAFEEKSGYVEVSTRAVVEDVPVVAWDSVKFSLAWQVAVQLGHTTLAEVAQVEPARLLDLAAVEDEVA